MKTLLVDDDFTSRLLLQKFLSRYGECHIAVHGKEAIDAFRTARAGGHAYDLVCMDILMPEMDGHTAVKLMRAFERERGVLPNAAAKIIVTTAVTNVEEVAMFLGDCDDYLPKPVDLGKLLGILEGHWLV